MGVIEVGLVFALNTAVNRGIRWPLALVAVFTALLLALGVLRHYVDIWTHRSVRGISFVFVALYALGDLTLLLSVLLQPEHDILGIVIYAVELMLWIGVFGYGVYYNLLPWWKSRQLHVLPERVQNENQSRPAIAVNSISLNEFPSSTSVFRTPSSEVEMRNRISDLRQIG
jgi:hypothetical protein